MTIDRACWEGYCLANPNLLYLIIPLALAVIVMMVVNLIKFKSDDEKKAFVKSKRWARITFAIIRTLMLLCLVIAFATPYRIEETKAQGDPSLTILADNSSSFKIFDTTIAKTLQRELEKDFPVNLKYIAFDDRSAIGDGILQNAEGDDNILIISDGYNNYGRDLGDIILYSSILNTSIHTLNLKPQKKDVSIYIEGPSQVIELSENQFRVIVNNIGDVSYHKLEVFVDGAPVDIDRNGRFTWRFSKGYHKIMARVVFPQDDFFEQNNIFHKSVKSLPRPKLLYVSNDKGPLQTAIEDVYDVTLHSTVPGDLTPYHSVVMNNINANKISDAMVDRLAEYMGDKGKGLVVVGGGNAFNLGNYKGSYFESILPAEVGVSKKGAASNVNVILVVDISESTGLGFSSSSGNSKIDVEKALAVNTLNSIALEDMVGVVAFNHLGHVVHRPTPLGESIDKIQEKLLALKDGGGTVVMSGLFKAISLLDKSQGSKNIIVISDGITQLSQDAINLAKDASDRGIRTYSIGVGDNTNEQFMKDLAAAGGGLYIKPTESEKIKILFGEPEDDASKDSMNLVVVDDNHWISRGDLDLQATLNGFNFVVPSTNGRKLIATDADRSVIVAGRYGLGRSVVMATDDGTGWSGELYSRQNSKLITRIINWAIGDFTKDGFDVRLRDTTVGKSTEINVISDSLPVEKGFEFSKVDAGVYQSTFRPKKEGFYQVLDATTAVSYNDEYQRIGMNPDLIELVTVSGGFVFEPTDIEKIKNTVISLSKRVKVESVNYRWPFLLAAIVIFLIDITIRRIRENRGGN